MRRAGGTSSADSTGRAEGHGTGRRGALVTRTEDHGKRVVEEPEHEDGVDPCRRYAGITSDCKHQSAPGQHVRVIAAGIFRGACGVAETPGEKARIKWPEKGVPESHVEVALGTARSARRKWQQMPPVQSQHSHSTVTAQSHHSHSTVTAQSQHVRYDMHDMKSSKYGGIRVRT